MVPSLRRLGPWALLALAGMALLVWLGLGGFAFSDYDREVAPSYLALAHGDVGGFLSLAPAYGGSLIMRAPARDAAGPVGRGRARGVPGRGAPVPARGRRPGRRARRADARPQRPPGDDRHRRLPLRRQPDHAARARHRPSRGAARGRALRRRRAGRAARTLDAWPASCSAWPSPTRPGRCSPSGPCCSRCRPIGGARWRSPAGSRWRSWRRCSWRPLRAGTRAPRPGPARSSSHGRCGGSSARPAR